MADEALLDRARACLEAAHARSLELRGEWAFCPLCFEFSTDGFAFRVCMECTREACTDCFTYATCHVCHASFCPQCMDANQPNTCPDCA